MECAGKLTGDAYRTYWCERMARGAAEAVHGAHADEADAQADLWWATVRRVMGPIDPWRVVEIGSGYGRMLKRMRQQWPEAQLFGYDLAPAAVANAWNDDQAVTLQIGSVPIARADLYVTCTALQHVTDDDVLIDLVADLKTVAPLGARIVILENIACPGVPHVRDMTAMAWRGFFGSLVAWDAEQLVHWRGQAHLALGGCWQ